MLSTFLKVTPTQIEKKKKTPLCKQRGVVNSATRKATIGHDNMMSKISEDARANHLNLLALVLARVARHGAKEELQGEERKTRALQSLSSSYIES